MKINNWVDELGISGENTINKNINMIIEVILLFIPRRKRNKDNEGVDKEPRGMLVDNRFDDVKGWGKLENGSSKRGINRGLDKEGGRIDDGKGRIINPKESKYNNTDINAAIGNWGRDIYTKDK